ncbi:MAG TPA: thioredoxin family protein [Nitrososphaerales archaeon]|nr:thioredoxin family protein [Nitrososphaerales archaeon]
MNYGEWLDEAEFQSRILGSKEPKIAVFEAKWCGFCRRFNELLKNFLPTNPPDAQLDVIDTDSGDGSLWEKFQIDIVPTIIVFKEGREIFRRNGVSMRGLNQGDLEAAIESTK